MAHHNRTTLIFFALLVGLSLLVKIFSTLTIPQNVILSVFRLPLRYISFSALPIQGFLQASQSVAAAEKLKRQNDDLRIRLMQLEEIGVENERLRRLLEFEQHSSFSLVAANVIAFDSSNVRRSVVINKGRKQNVAIGDPVITAEGVVGVIVEAVSEASRVLLMNDPDFSVAAKINRSNEIGVISGSLEGLCKLKYLGSDADVKVGDTVVSLGRNSHFPSGIPIGRVVRLARDPSGLTAFIVIDPAANLTNLEEVLVIVR